MNTTSSSFKGDPRDEMLANDACDRDYPPHFPSREAWDAYNAEIARREDSLEYKILHGVFDTITEDLPF